MDDSHAFDPAPLVADLVAGDADRRAEAAEALCRAGAAASAAVVPLVRACGDEDDRVREWAVAALEDIGPPPDGLSAQLAELVASTDALVAYWAATLLGRSGRNAASAVTALAGCLASSADVSVRQRAAWALGKVGPAARAARDALQKAAADADPRVARLAREAVEAIGG
jgi:HEAT repeat protein